MHTPENTPLCGPCPVDTICRRDEMFHKAQVSVYHDKGGEADILRHRIADHRSVIESDTHPESAKELSRRKLDEAQVILNLIENTVKDDFAPPYDMAELRANCPEGATTAEYGTGTFRFCGSLAISEEVRDETALPITD